MMHFQDQVNVMNVPVDTQSPSGAVYLEVEQGHGSPITEKEADDQICLYFEDKVTASKHNCSNILELIAFEHQRLVGKPIVEFTMG